MQTVFSHIIQKRFSQVNEDVATDAMARSEPSAFSRGNFYDRAYCGCRSAMFNRKDFKGVEDFGVEILTPKTL